MGFKIKRYLENGISVYLNDTPQVFDIEFECETNNDKEDNYYFHTQFGWLDYGDDKKTFFRITLPTDNPNYKFIPRFNQKGELFALECLVEGYDSNCMLANELEELSNWLQSF